MEEISAKLVGFNKGRLPGLLPLKYDAMAENLFRFYRGTNHIFFEDLASGVQLPASPTTWICGDLHLENFGSYKSGNRLVYFDLNDFDDAILAPASWELVRMVTSIFIAFDSLRIEPAKAMKMAELFLRSYARTLLLGKPDYIEPQTATGIVKDFLTAVSKRKQRDILEKRTILKRKKVEILLDDSRHLELEEGFKTELSEHINTWLKHDGNSPYNYKVTDAVFRLAGTSSLGLKRYALLLKSLNKEGEKYMLIDMKEAAASSLAPFVQNAQSLWKNEAERIITIQQRMQNRPPALLSTTSFRDNCYMVQEIQPNKDSINFKLLRKEYRHMYQVIDSMGMLAASSQLRSSGRQGSETTDSLIDFAADEKWQREILYYSVNYAAKVEQYYSQFLSDYHKHVFVVEDNKSANTRKTA